LYNLNFHVKEVANLNGNIAEIGVYRGQTAKVIAEAMNEKNLYLFDTFEGIPKPDKIDKHYDFVNGQWLEFYEGQYKATIEELKETLKNCNGNIFIHKGLFPKETGKFIEDNSFCFVHLDVDLYKGTYDSLVFFYSKMESLGRIISHNYNAPGVKKAFNDFFNDKPEEPISITHNQIMVVKL
jgi:O-methyltransferase